MCAFLSSALHKQLHGCYSLKVQLLSGFKSWKWICIYSDSENIAVVKAWF